MSLKVREGDLLFEFDERWEPVLSWDRHAAYRTGIKAMDNGKAVDFIGVFDHRRLFFIEVKDYRMYERTKVDPPWVEFELKVRNTVAGLVGSGRRDTYAGVCTPFLKALLHPRELTLVFWNEQPPLPASEAFRKRRKVDAEIDAQRATRYVKWLDARAIIVSQEDQYERLVPGLKVQNLSRKRRELAEAVEERLRRRGIDVGEGPKRRISEERGEDVLELWLDRAATVLTIEELFRDRR